MICLSRYHKYFYIKDIFLLESRFTRPISPRQKSCQVTSTTFNLSNSNLVPVFQYIRYLFPSTDVYKSIYFMDTDIFIKIRKNSNVPLSYSNQPPLSDIVRPEQHLHQDPHLQIQWRDLSRSFSRTKLI